MILGFEISLFYDFKAILRTLLMSVCKSRLVINQMLKTYLNQSDYHQIINFKTLIDYW